MGFVVFLKLKLLLTIKYLINFLIPLFISWQSEYYKMMLLYIA